MDSQRSDGSTAGDPAAPTGMGRSDHRPEFLAAAPAPRPGPAVADPTAVTPSGYRPSRRPAVISALAIALVAVVVAAASLVARYADTHVVAPTRTVAPAPGPPSSAEEIEFVSQSGSGKLVMIDRSWVRHGDAEPVNGSYLRIDVELVCETGRIDYDPYNFQAFDRNGKLFEFTEEGAGASVLDVGTLRAGESVTGQLAFDMPRGGVTLLMSDESEQTVTALRVPD